MPGAQQTPSPIALSDSEREVLTAIFGGKSVPRSSLTEQTTLSQQSVHRLLEGLRAKAFVRFGDPVVVGRGKPSPTVEIDPGRYFSVGLSVTTEAVHISFLSLSGVLLDQITAQVVPDDPQAVMDALERDLAARLQGAWANRELIGIGVAMQGFRTGDRQRFHTPPLLSRWDQFPIISSFESRFSLPAFAENNATASAMAESYLGLSQKHNCIAYLSFNYGFGGGAVVNGAPLIGELGNAGELHSLFELVEIQKRPALGELLKRLNANGIKLSSVSELAQRYDPDWPGLEDWFDEVRPQLNMATRALKAILDPGAIYFGGEAPQALRRSLIDLVKDDWPRHKTPNPKLVESTISGDASHLGAAFLPLHGLVFG